MNHQGARSKTLSAFRLCCCFLSIFWGTAMGARAANPQTIVVPLPATNAHLAPLGRLAQNSTLNLVIGLPWRNPAALAELLRQINDPAGTNYHQYLTPQQFADKFGPTAADYQAVTAFAQSHGLRVTGTHPNRLLLDVAGSVTDVERTLHVTMHTYRHPTENRTFFAPDTQPSLDLGVPILGISGLNNYELPHPRYKVKSLAAGHTVAGNVGSGPGATYLGGDFRAAYVPDSTLTGTGQTLGLLQFDGYTPADITYYENLAGLPSVPLQNVLIDGFDGYPSGDGGEVEVSLDIEMSVSMAPGLSQIIVYEAPQGGSWHDILNRMATDDLARQMSCSWYIPGGPADPVADQIWEEMAAQGQTFFTASGDDDAYTGLINFPNDSPYITQVGGTTLTTTGPRGAWSGETVWNWGALYGGSGGGISTQYPIPTWQTNISMVANQGSTTKRNIPDVALTADNVYVRADDRDYDDIGGTSCASPLWAAFAALVNQQAAASGQPPVGFLNPALDTIGSSAAYAACFHDITTGNNESPASPTRFSAVPGYDLCTGWGTPAGQNLINALANPESLRITPLAGFNSSGRVGGPFTTTTENLILTNGGKYGLAWTLSNPSTWLNVSSTNGYLTPGGVAATVTVSLNAAAAKLPIGTNIATLWFTNILDRVGQGRVFSLSIIAPPVITAQPANQTVLDGAAAAFSVSATGGQPLAYQWRDNGTNLMDNSEITGSATSNLVLTAVAAAQAGVYSVVITNAAGQVVSLSAQLTVPSSPPVFTAEPTNVTVYAGRSAHFAVTVVGTKPCAYQWQVNATAIPGATNALLTLTNLQVSQSGDYSVQVSNIYGLTNSTPVVLTVNPPPPCAPVSVGMVGWWSGEGTADDNVGTNNGSLVGGVSFTPGEVGQAFSFDGGGYVSIPDSPSLDSVTTNMTIEAWIKVTQFSDQDWISMVSKGDASWELRRFGTGSTLSFWTAGLSTPELEGTRNITDGQWHHVAGVYDGTNKYIYVDGTLDVSTPATGSIALDGFPLAVGDSPDNTQRAFDGAIDEISVYNRALSAGEIENIYMAGLGGKCPVPIAITVQPTNEIVNAGGSATFGVVATGMQPVSFQWSFAGIDLAGATNAILTIEDVQPSMGGIYGVTVSDAFESVTSSNALLTVLAQSPTILTQPASQTNFVGATLTFSVSVGGTPPLVYQWSFDSTNLVGATNATLTLGDVQLDQAGEYAVTVTNVFGLATSSNALLTVLTQPPTIITQPVGETNYEGTTAVFSIVVGGTAPLSYQWSFNAADLPGGTNATLILTNVQLSQVGAYGVTITNLYGAATSSIVDLTVIASGSCVPPAPGLISWWPAEGSANDTIGANNGTLVGPVSYAPGKVGEAFSFNGGDYVSIPDSPSLDALTTNLTVEAWVNVTQFSPQDWISFVSKGDFAWELRRYGTSSTASFWTKNVSNPELEGTRNIADGKWHHIAGVYDGTTKYLYVDGTLDASEPATGPIATNSEPLAIGDSPDNTARALDGLVDEVSVYKRALSASEIAAIYNAGSVGKCPPNPVPPVISTQPTNETVVADETATFAVVAGGTPPLSYAWSYNGTILVGATNAMLVLPNVQLNQAGEYSVTVANPSGAATSSNALLTVIPGASCTPPPAGLVSWWTGQGNANDSVGTNNGTLAGGVVFASGEVGQAFSLNGSAYVAIPDSASLDALTTNITIEAWIKVTQFSSQDWISIICKGDSSWELRRFGAGSTLSFWTAGLSTPELEGSRNVNDGLWHHVAGVYDGTRKYLYVDGTLDASTPATGSIAVSGDPLWFGDNPDAAQRYFDGLVDEVSLYNRALSAGQIAAIYAAGGGGKCPPGPPEIISQPTNETYAVGGTAIFSVGVSGSSPVTYHWTFNGVNMAGATNNPLILTNVQFAAAGNYAVLVANSYGSVLSSNAVLVVNPLYHFVWNPILSPRFVNTPFAVVLQAQNAGNGLATNFTSTVALQSTNGLPIFPHISANFVQGGWTGAVTVARSVTNLVLQATDNLGEFGLANSINVVNLPTVTTVASDGTLLILWPVLPSGFILETTTGLFPANWIPVTSAPFPIGDQNLLPVPASGTNAFYRLRFTGQ